MKHVITVIYFTDNAGKAHTIEFSLKRFILLAAGFLALMLVLTASKWQKRMEQTFSLSMDNVIKTVIVFVFSADGDLLIKKEAAL